MSPSKCMKEGIYSSSHFSVFLDYRVGIYLTFVVVLSSLILSTKNVCTKDYLHSHWNSIILYICTCTYAYSYSVCDQNEDTRFVENIFSTDRPGIGVNIIYFFIEGIFFFIFTLFLEVRWRARYASDPCVLP